MPDLVEALPSPLRKRATAAFKGNAASLEKSYNTLFLLQEATLYLASLAFAEYRGTAQSPAVEAEMALARYVAGDPTFTNYRELLLSCVEATGESSQLRSLVDATFGQAQKLEILRQVSAERPQRVRPEYETRVEDLGSPNGQLPKLREYLDILSRFRNEALAHSDWHAFDGAEDFFDVAASALKQVAREFFQCHQIKAAWRALSPATVHNIDRDEGPPYEYGVNTIDNNESVTVRMDPNHRERPIASSPEIAEGDEVMLVRPKGGKPLLVPYKNLTYRKHPEPAISPIVDREMDADKPGEALAALVAFAHIAKRRKRRNGQDDSQTLRERWLPQPLVDDVVVTALQHFKLNGDTMEKDIPRNARILLELTNTKLAPRVVRTADRFAEVTVRHPSEPPSRRRRTRGSPRGASHKLRLDEAIELGGKCDESARKRLEEMAQNDPSRKVRKHALLSLGHGPGQKAGVEVGDLLMRFAERHRDDPEMASCALIALGALKDVPCVDFIVKYIRSNAPYACTDAAAWALAAFVERQPENVRKRKETLCRFATNRQNDPYTRGSVLFCLGKLRDPKLTGRIAALVHEQEDPFVVEDACVALGAIGDPASVPTLAKVLPADSGALADMCVKREAIRALGVIGGTQATAALEGYEPPRELRFIVRVLQEALSRSEASSSKRHG